MRLHGREAEQEVIDGLLASARTGRSGAVVVRGAAGIGKTALLGYAAAAADGMLLLRATGVETEAEFAFGGLQLLLRPVLDYLERLPGPQCASAPMRQPAQSRLTRGTTKFGTGSSRP